MRTKPKGRAVGFAVALGLAAALSTSAAPSSSSGWGSVQRAPGTLEAWAEAIGSWWDGLATWLAGPVGGALEPPAKEGPIRDPNGVPGAPPGGGG
jgi:hypothetical protein